ncbi:hypothetical protein MPER_03195, partial [Moniliophthora perniciosa FA553]
AIGPTNKIGIWWSLTDQVNIFLGFRRAEQPESAPWATGTWKVTEMHAEFALVQQLRTPAVLSSSDTNSQELEGSVIEGFNSKLAAKIEAFKGSNSDISTYLYDSYAGFTKILDDPTSYGFRDATTYGEGEDIFWG